MNSRPPWSRATERARRIRLFLSLCARAEPTPEQQRALRRAAREPPAPWEELVEAAEVEGLSPLLREHLLRAEVPTPAEAKRALAGLAMRHRRVHAARVEIMAEMLSALQARGIDSLLLKGAASSFLVYPDPALRTMRDVDLLVDERAIGDAIRALGAAGFTVTGKPEAAHHAPPLRAERRGIAVHAELHTRLGLHHPSGAELGRQRLRDLYGSAQPVDVAGVTAAAPGPEDMVRHAWRHGFTVPLDWEWFRLNGVADLVSMVERWVDRIDWSELRALDPAVVRALPMLHALTPWSERVTARLGAAPARRPLGVGLDYYGWLRSPERRGPLARASLLRETLFPSEHFVRLRHGGGPGAAGVARSFLGHWRELARRRCSRTP